MRNPLNMILTLLFTIGFLAQVQAQELRDLPYQQAKLVVVPGVSAGPIELGKPMPGNIESLLGPPTKRTDRLVLWTQSTYLNFEEGVMAKLGPDGQVESIFICTFGARTSGGAGIGDSSDAVRAAHPDAKYVQHRGADALEVPGLSITLTMDGRAAQFFVH